MSAESGEAPRRVPVGGGAWIRFRRVTPEKAVITGPGGRFMLLPVAEIDAIVAGDPGGARRRKLAEMGFLLPSDGQESRGAALSDEAALHVVHLRGAAEAGTAPGSPKESEEPISISEDATSMDREIAGAVVERIFEGARGFVHVELCDSDPLDADVVRLFIERARARSAAAGRRLSIGLRTSLEGMTPDLAATLARERVVVKCLLDGPPGAAEIIRIQNLHAAFASIGVAPSLAFVNGVVPLTSAAIAAGPEALVVACTSAGLVFVELSRAPDVTAAEHFDFYSAVVRRILEVQSTGTLLVEMRLALHLETLVTRADPSRGAPPPEPRTTIWTPDGQPRSPDPAGFAEGCGGCPYDPYCGTGILHDALDDRAERRWGTPFCRTSTGTFDSLFQLLASPDGPRLRTILRAWMDAHERVARRLGAAG